MAHVFLFFASIPEENSRSRFSGGNFPSLQPENARQCDCTRTNFRAQENFPEIEKTLAAFYRMCGRKISTV
jgi:hypothetical protein